MLSNSMELTKLFFRDLKTYNQTNFRTIRNADLSTDNPVVHKAFSSVVTRYFIFCERHPEISETDKRILYFKLKIDMISRYFSEYPDTDTDQLKAFQVELRNYVKDCKEVENANSKTTVTISDFQPV